MNRYSWGINLGSRSVCHSATKNMVEFPTRQNTRTLQSYKRLILLRKRESAESDVNESYIRCAERMIRTPRSV